MLFPSSVTNLPFEELMEYTDNFNKENCLGRFQFGEVYRGKIVCITCPPQYVLVKIWKVPEVYNYRPGDNEQRLMDERILLQHEELICHPGMLKLYGFCIEGEHLGVVYDFKPLDVVSNLILEDDFTWLQRIKVALGFARLLKFLHAGQGGYKPLLIRNIDAAHIVLDEEYNPKLFDFGMVSGGILPDRTLHQDQYVYGCYGYIDPFSCRKGGWTDKCDVFAFGVVLLGLITKRIYREEDRLSFAPTLYERARDEYYSDSKDIKQPKRVRISAEGDSLALAPTLYGGAQDEHVSDNMGIDESTRSLVHASLAAESVFCYCDGPKITRLAMQCVETSPEERPTMKQVVKCLLKLQVVKDHAELLAVNNVLCAYDIPIQKWNIIY